MSSTTGQPRNRRYIRVSQQRKTKLRWPENSIQHQNVRRRRSSSSSASIYIRVYTSEADFRKPEIYRGRVRLWATEWDVFHCTPSRGGRDRRAAVDIFRGVFFSVWWDFVFFSLSLLRTHTAYCKYESTLPHVPLYYYRGAYRVPLFNLSVGLCVRVCVLLVVFRDRESCTRTSSTNL